jgi:hypothetical protein
MPGSSRRWDAVASQLVVGRCHAALDLGWPARLLVVGLRCRVLTRASFCRRATSRVELATVLVDVVPTPPLVLPIARGPSRVPLLVMPRSAAWPQRGWAVSYPALSLVDAGDPTQTSLL